MSKATFKLPTAQIRAKIQRIREAFPRVVAAGLQQIAEEALAERYGSGGAKEAAEWDRGMVHGRLRKLDALFVPVTLKHVRREQFPDLRLVYEAMVKRKQHTYRGRSRFWVDATKLASFERELLARSLRRLSAGKWKISLGTAWGDIRVSVRKQGRITKADKAAAADVVRVMKSIFAARASAMLYDALSS